jgi:hypothetical protein
MNFSLLNFIKLDKSCIKIVSYRSSLKIPVNSFPNIVNSRAYTLRTGLLLKLRVFKFLESNFLNGFKVVISFFSTI